MTIISLIIITETQSVTELIFLVDSVIEAILVIFICEPMKLI